MINTIVHKNAVKYRGTEKEMKPISEYLKENYLICDGAFGTYYAEKYNREQKNGIARELFRGILTETQIKEVFDSEV